MPANTPNPAPSPSVPSGSRVVVVVSRGPLPGPRQGAASVPELLGKEQGDALERIQSVDLSAEVFNDFSDRVKRGYVFDQFPRAGSSVPVNSQVVVLVSNGSAEKTAPTALPDVVGMHEADALAAVAAAGLETQVARDYHPNADEGVVIAQLPSQAAVAHPKRGGSLAWLWIAIAVVLVLAAVGAAFFLLLGRQVTVPNVTAKPQTQAEQMLQSVGLKTGTVTPFVNPNVAAGTVLQQSPLSGVQVSSGTAVDLVVAEGVPQGAVPNLVGLNGPDAKTAVAAAGFVPDASDVYNNTVPKGAVISQSPAAGTQAPRGSTVKYNVSLGSPNPSTKVTVPDFTGMTQSDAVSKVNSLGLTSRIVSEYSSTVVNGVVFDQTPPAGKLIPSGTTIGLGISLGAAPPGSVTVPDLVGQTTSTAQQSLSAIGLLMSIVNWDSTGSPAGMVVGQTPNGGHIVPNGSTVIVFVSSGK